MEKFNEVLVGFRSLATLLPWTTAAILLTTISLWTYHRLFLGPIPGIPYNVRSARRILGDVPEFLSWRKETGEMWSFVKQRALDLDSPIFQLFMKGPFSKPWVIVTDFRENQDIQSMRQGEFDRSTWLGDVFGPLLPGNHVWMQSNDQFRANRNILKDTMSPAFLNNVAAPGIHSAIHDLVTLWREKIRLSQGRPFQADVDIIRGVVDAIFLASMGLELGLNTAQEALLSGLDSVAVSADIDSPVNFPSAQENRAYTAVRELVNSIQIGMSSPWPKVTMKFVLKFFPSLVAARRYTDNTITEVLRDAWSRVSKVQPGEFQIEQAKCAADLMVLREAQQATKQNRPFQYDTQAIRDELLGFYLAGHETTSTTICWAVKNLTEHQDVQQELRLALRSAHPDAVKENRLPSAREIVETSVPYLDAFIEENHRLGAAIPTMIRRTARDATVLGHKIPKDTDVFMMVNGPSFQGPALPVDESTRSETSQATKDRYGTWNEDDVGRFVPERFLVKDQGGHDRFNPFAGPVLPYGAGLRGCFGIRLATLELRVIITLIAWAFELQPTPPSLSSFQGNDVNTHRAKQTYLRLVEV